MPDAVTETLELIIKISETDKAEAQIDGLVNALKRLSREIEILNSIETTSKAITDAQTKAWEKHASALASLKNKVTSLVAEQNKQITITGKLGSELKKQEASLKKAAQADETYAKALVVAKHSMKELNDEIKSAKGNHEKIAVALKNEAANIAFLNKEIKQNKTNWTANNTAIQKNVASLRRANLQYERAKVSLSKFSDKLVTSKRKAEAYEKSLDGLKRTAEENSKAFNELKSIISTMNNDLVNINRPLAVATKSVVGLTAGVASLAIAFGGFAAKEAAEFELEMQNINTLLIGMEKDFSVIRDSILELSTQVPQSAQDIARAFYFIQSATSLGANALSILEAATKGAVAGFTTTEIAADGLTTVLNAYSLTADKATYVTDVLFATVVKGKLTFDQLSQNIGGVAAISNLANTSLEELGALIAALTKGTGQVEKSITSLRAAMNSVIKPTNDQRDAFKRLKITLDDGLGGMRSFADIMEDIAKADIPIQDLARLFPQIRALRGVAVLANDWSLFTDSLETTADAAGKTEEAFQKMINTLGNQVVLLGGNLNRLVIDFGTQMIPILSDVVASFINLAQEFKAFNDVADITGSIVKNTLGVALNELIKNVNVLANNLPKIIGGLDFSKLKAAAKDLLGIFDFDLGTIEGWQEAFQLVIDTGTGLIEFMSGLIPVVKVLVNQIVIAVKVFNDLSSSQKKIIGGIGATSVVFDFFGRRIGEVTSSVISLVTQFTVLNLLVKSTNFATLGGSLPILAKSLQAAGAAVGVVGAGLAGWTVGSVLNEVLGIEKSIIKIHDTLNQIGEAGTKVEKDIQERLRISLGIAGVEQAEAITKITGENLATIFKKLDIDFFAFIEKIRKLRAEGIPGATPENIFEETEKAILEATEAFNKTVRERLIRAPEVADILSEGLGQLELDIRFPKDKFIKSISDLSSDSSFTEAMKSIANIIEEQTKITWIDPRGSEQLIESTERLVIGREKVVDLVTSEKKILNDHVNLIGEILEKADKYEQITGNSKDLTAALLPLFEEALSRQKEINDVSISDKITKQEIIDLANKLNIELESVVRLSSSAVKQFKDLKAALPSEEEEKIIAEIEKEIRSIAKIKRFSNDLTLKEILNNEELHKTLTDRADVLDKIKQKMEEINKLDFRSIREGSEDFEALVSSVKNILVDFPEAAEAIIATITDKTKDANETLIKENEKLLKDLLIQNEDFGKTSAEQEISRLRRQQQTIRDLKLEDADLVAKTIAAIDARIQQIQLKESLDRLKKAVADEVSIKRKALNTELKDRERLQSQLESLKAKELSKTLAGISDPSTNKAARDALEQEAVDAEKRLTDIIIGSRKDLGKKELDEINKQIARLEDSLKSSNAKKLESDTGYYSSQIELLKENRGRVEAELKKTTEITTKELVSLLPEVEKEYSKVFSTIQKLGADAPRELIDLGQTLRESLELLRETGAERIVSDITVDVSFDLEKTQIEINNITKLIDDTLASKEFIITPKVTDIDVDGEAISRFNVQFKKTFNESLADIDPKVFADKVARQVLTSLQQELETTPLNIDIDVTTNTTIDGAEP